MDQKYQEEFRIKIHKEYLEEAFACFSNFDLLGEKNAGYIKQRQDYESKIKATEKAIADAVSLPPTERYDKQKALKKDLKNYKDALQATIDVGKKTEDEAGKWQDRACTHIERAEHVLRFKLNTPAEILANKQKREAAAAGTTVDTKVEEVFKECESCAAKPGSPELCADCVARRKAITEKKL